MAKNNSNLRPRGLRLFSSISAKVTLILVSMGAVSVLIGFLASLVFTRVTDDMDELTAKKLHTLAQSSALVAAADKTKNAMITMMLARHEDALEQSSVDVEQATQSLNEIVANLPDATRALVEEDARSATDMLAELTHARNIQFKNEAGIETQLAELQMQAAKLKGNMIELSDDANFSLSVGGEETMFAVETTLSELVENQFATLQTLLEARSEVNLLSGTLLAYRMTNDFATKNFLGDITKASLKRLTDINAVLEANEQTAPYAQATKTATELFKKSINGRGSRFVGPQHDLMDARRKADASLSTAVDDMVYALTVAAEDASTNNRDAIQSLLDDEVGHINALFEISSWTGRFQESALKVVVAPGIEEVKAASIPMQQAAKALYDYRDFGDGRLAEELTAIAALADPATGLTAYKIAALSADTAAAKAVTAASDAVLKIGNRVAEIGDDSQSEIATMATGIQSEVAQAEQRVNLLLAMAGAVLLVALVLTRLMIQRPLRQISETTERLAGGDMQKVTGFDRASDEVFRIANALSVFRDGLIEKQEMAVKQDAERQARMAEQTGAVSAIGSGLERLSKGDVSLPIDGEMAEGYAKLRDDFNRAQENLRDMLLEMKQVSSSVFSGAAEISSASGDLSGRTENQAATLEETAAAIDEITTNVDISASNAHEVEENLGVAKKDAEQSGDVVQNAIRAMHEIKDSSDKISQIVGVIDDIAFQTNLLALNAGVEAARAGAAGSGFAVVASEVRALAQRSSEAAMEIKTLIHNGASRVDHGVALVGNAGDALVSMLSRFEDVSAMVAGIVNSSNEQALSLKEINDAMANLDRVTQDNAAMVQQSTAATSKLNSDATTMSKLIAHFVTKPATEEAATDPGHFISVRSIETEVTCDPEDGACGTAA
ncbi:methyl-accepting chemotaxis protein [Sediminimonas qiaohouensis]|uniref:methyl-accepting chemotaxis protein n=1 Tax=Sediminimonas qiaohouensis TaxID=552061 RepID=UPI000684CA81|nr:methyl-accepting chemotaxis protein [Sediminimonas qiaohouensis]